MAKRKTSGRKATRKMAKKTQRAARSAKRPSKSKRSSKPKKAAKARKSAPKKKATQRSKSRTAEPTALRSTPARLSRQRRTLDDLVLPTPPSSLDMDRRGSAARSGRAEMAEEHAKVATMTPDINAGDVDVNVEDAYFVGDEAPGGDNPTPDQDVVDEIGKALGVEYQDAEELRSGDKVADRDKHRWELDPASSEDYKNRK
ncbi:MAG TPA: DUF6335 family protein [Vicinamibacterales bacterium]